MARYECSTCGLVETLTFAPDACSSCGHGVMVDLDATEALAKRDAIIAEQNDRFRKEWPVSAPIEGRIVLTHGVSELGAETVRRILDAVRTFDTFTADNDPFGTHDFGSIEIENGGAVHRLFWKIDLYDRNYKYGSDHPDNPAETRRVLTILLPSEY